MNLLFISGPQGGGKTTLLEAISDERILIPQLETKTTSFDVKPLNRIALKICQRCLENFESYQVAIKNPDKIILGNRCIYDQLAFNWVYYKRGWITEERKNYFDEVPFNLYIEELREPRAIVLNPGYNIVKEHLEKRWLKKEKKWREEDEKYIKLVCESYDRFRDNDKIYYIDHEIDLKKKEEIDNIRKWIIRN